MTGFKSGEKEICSKISSLQNQIDKLKKLAGTFLELEESLHVIAEFSNDWEYWQGPDGNYRYVSPSCELITGYTPNDFYQNKDLLKKIVVADDWPKWQSHHHSMGEMNKVEPIEFKIRTKSGEEKWIHHVCRTVTGNDGRKLGVRGSNRDITELKVIQEQLKHLAGHDPLTGLANRTLFFEHFHQRLKDAGRKNGMFVVVFIDLDNFKEINDTYGHNAGDQVLKRVAAELRGYLRTNDIIARFGGDEFAGIFNIVSPADGSTIMEKILKQVGSVINCNKFEINIHLSVGMSVFPQDGDSVDQLLKKADDNMYAMKTCKKSDLNPKPELK